MVRFFLLTLCIFPSQNCSAFYEQLLEKAYENSKDFKMVRHLREQKKHNLMTSWSHALPKIELSLSTNTQRDYTFLVSGILPSSFQSFQPPEVSLKSWTAKAIIPIFQKTLINQIFISDRDAQISEFNFEIEKRRIDTTLTQLFGEYLVTLFTLHNLELSTDSARKREREIQVRYQVGQKTEIDFLKAQANRATLESRKLTAEQEEAVKLKMLLDYCGIEPKTFTLLKSSVPQLEKIEALENFIESFGQKNSPAKKVEPFLASEERTLKQLERSLLVRRLQAEEILVKNQSASLSAQEWPSLALSGQLSTINTDFNALWNAPPLSYSVGLMLTIPFFLGGSSLSTQWEIQEAEKVAETKREKELNELRINVESNRLKIISLNKLLNSLEIQAESQSRIYELSQKSYALGRITMTELLESQNTDLDTKIQLSRTRLDLLNSLKLFAFQLGVL